MPNLQYRQQKIQEKRKQTPWREFVMHKMSRKSLTYKKHDGLISRFPSSPRIGNVVSTSDWNQLIDTLSTAYSKDYDSGTSFFHHFQALFSHVPQPNVIHYTSNEAADYADCILGSSSIYLSSTVIRACENILYSLDVRYDSKNIFNSLIVYPYCENIYQSVSISESYNIFFSKYIATSSNIWFSTNLTGCSECLFCNDLENCSYYIHNVAYEKSEYESLKQALLQNKERFTFSEESTKMYGANIQSSQVSGSSIKNSFGIEDGYYVYGLKYGRNVALVGSDEGDENFYDTFLAGRGKDFYGLNDCGGFSENCYISSHLTGCHTVYYSYYLTDCSFCLGCVGLKNKSFCIFNKQYTKEERHQQVCEIFSAMEQEGVLGDFFPGWLNPFYFNDTAAYLIDDSFTKEEVEAEGYLRRDEEVKVDIPEGMEVVKTSELGEYEGWKTSPQTPLPEGEVPLASTDGAWWIDSAILDKVIQDEQGNIYRIVKMEYDFLMKHGLPLPRLHWLDRLKINFKIT